MNIKDYLPEHEHLTITHNRHKFYGETVGQFLKSQYSILFFSEQDEETAILMDELWIMTIHSYNGDIIRLGASDFEMLMKLSKEYK